MSLIKIIFFQVKDTTAKLSKICQTVFLHFEKREPIVILAPNQTSIDFVDALLWRYPESSFLPHAISSNPTDALITITSTDESLNQTPRVFNLTAAPIMAKAPIKIVYEFEDLTNEEKKQISQQKYLAYRKEDFPISCL